MKHTPTNAELQQQPITVEQALQQAIIHHKSNQLQDAERIYRAILQVHPHHPDANHNIGIIAVQVNQPAAGLPYFKAALDANRSQIQYWLSYINALELAGEIETARQVLEQGRQSGINCEAFDNYSRRLEDKTGIIPKKPDKESEMHREGKPELEELKELMNLFTKGQYEKVVTLAQNLTVRFPLFGFGWMMLGTAFKQAGQSTSALENMQKAVELSPRESRWHCDLGALFHELNRFDEAIASHLLAIEIEPNLAEAHYNLGNTFHALSRFQEAENSYRKAIKIKPEYAKAYNNIGNTLMKLGRMDEAKNNFQLALNLKPDYAEAYNNMGNLLREMGLLEEALVNCNQAIKIKPDYAEAHNNLGNTLKDLDRIDEALISYRRSLEIKPDFAEVHINIGNILKELSRLDEAEASIRRALQINPGSAEAHNDLGGILKELQRFGEAEASCWRALEIRPDYADAHINIAKIFLDLGNRKKGIYHLEKAININPTLPLAHKNMGVVLQNMNKIDEALNHFEKALEIKKDYVDAYYGIALIKKTNSKDPSFDILLQILKKPTATHKEKMLAHFSLGKMYADIQEYDKAFSHYLSGHQNRAQYLNHSYDHSEDDNTLSLFKNIITPELFEKTPYKSNTIVPIFVLGFPRSGTSLVEHILSSHSSVYGAGELEDIKNISSSIWNDLSIDKTKQMIQILTVDKLQALEKLYLNRLQELSNGSPKVVDKMPHNFINLWFIALLFPKATILHCTRNPMDTCLSCFFQNFTKKHSYTDDLLSLGRHYVFYRNLMSYWKTVCPIPIHEVNYEQLVKNPESEIRKLLDICGLEFEANCLEFHKTKRYVNTASSIQVRQKIYKSSLEKWRRYEKYLGTLFETIGKF